MQSKVFNQMCKDVFKEAQPHSHAPSGKVRHMPTNFMHTGMLKVFLISSGVLPVQERHFNIFQSSSRMLVAIVHCHTLSGKSLMQVNSLTQYASPFLDNKIQTGCTACALTFNHVGNCKASKVQQ